MCAAMLSIVCCHALNCVLPCSQLCAAMLSIVCCHALNCVLPCSQMCAAMLSIVCCHALNCVLPCSQLCAAMLSNVCCHALKCVLPCSQMCAAMLSNVCCHALNCVLPCSQLVLPCSQLCAAMLSIGAAMLSNVCCHALNCVLPCSQLCAAMLSNVCCHALNCVLPCSQMCAAMLSNVCCHALNCVLPCSQMCAAMLSNVCCHALNCVLPCSQMCAAMLSNVCCHALNCVLPCSQMCAAMLSIVCCHALKCVLPCSQVCAAPSSLHFFNAVASCNGMRTYLSPLVHALLCPPLSLAPIRERPSEHEALDPPTTDLPVEVLVCALPPDPAHPVPLHSLHEFLEFYRLSGAARVVLYDNGAWQEGGMAEQVAGQVERGEVVVVPFHGSRDHQLHRQGKVSAARQGKVRAAPPGQGESCTARASVPPPLPAVCNRAWQGLAAQDCAWGAGYTARWVVPAELNEFLFTGSQPAALPTFLRAHGAAAVVTVGSLWWSSAKCSLDFGAGEQGGGKFWVERMVYRWPWPVCHDTSAFPDANLCLGETGYRKPIVDPRKVEALGAFEARAGGGEGGEVDVRTEEAVYNHVQDLFSAPSSSWCHELFNDDQWPPPPSSPHCYPDPRIMPPAIPCPPLRGGGGGRAPSGGCGTPSCATTPTRSEQAASVTSIKARYVCERWGVGSAALTAAVAPQSLFPCPLPSHVPPDMYAVSHPCHPSHLPSISSPIPLISHPSHLPSLSSPILLISHPCLFPSLAPTFALRSLFSQHSFSHLSLLNLSPVTTHRFSYPRFSSASCCRNNEPSGLEIEARNKIRRVFFWHINP
ncbi:unnamed protein product [Closterium sp. Naga37s-1]|nr:unnamed protein product [Closterium sp. Naga37s-1]